ncbi:MAG: dihydrofolate reductase [Rhodocyclaceae bacterium]
MNGPLHYPPISIVVAVADNGVIGRDNRLLWRQREDMRHFKALTLGSPVIMGRKTWESIGRPLPQRRNIVITRQAAYVAEGAECVSSLDEALASCSAEDRVFVIGGGEIYQQAIPLAECIHCTYVHCAPQGDTYFPAPDVARWKEAERIVGKADEFNEFDYDFVKFVRF